jgi:hydroxymethylglutaryl-CoA lyase
VTVDEPTRVLVTDVSMRDGLQNEPTVFATETKLRILSELADAGVRSMEVGSFVRPDKVPQMADTDEVVRRLTPMPQLDHISLVPNGRGAERAIAAGARHLRVVLSASEGHSMANTNRPVRAGLDEMRGIMELVANEPAVRVSAAVAVAFVCPFDGVTPVGRVRDIVGELHDLGMREISLADTLGMANPEHVERLVGEVRTELPDVRWNLHIHNTYGMGLANVCAGLRQGVDHFDAALGGIGGCPFAPGAAGNLATEDLVYMLTAMGFETGIDLRGLQQSAAHLRAGLGRGLESSVSRALAWAS